MPERTDALPDNPDDQGADGTRTERDTHQPGDRQGIAERAYERYEKRGGEPGRDQEDWFEAERELRENE